MSSSDERIRGWVDDLLDRTRGRLHADLTALVSNLTDAMSAEVADRQAEAAEAARREAEVAGAALTSEAVATERRAAEERLAEAIAALRSELAADHERAIAELRTEAAASVTSTGSHDASPPGVTSASALRLPDALRALDAAQTLSDILDELARQSVGFARRSAVLLNRSGKLYAWSWHGFPSEAGAARDYASEVGETGICAIAVRTGAPATGGPATIGGAPPSDRDRAVAVPLRAGGDVVAVLYADKEGEPAHAAGEGVSAPPAAQSDEGVWARPIEALARYAERCLQAVVVRSLPELLRAGAVERARRRTLRYDDEAAERYARLLVAEIKLYHETLVDEARRERNLLRKLRPQIERAQQLYDERVAPAVRARTKYFEQELVRTLAGGDPSLLGQHT